MHSWSDNIELMVNDKEEEVIASFESLLNRAIVALGPRGDLAPQIFDN